MIYQDGAQRDFVDEGYVGEPALTERGYDREQAAWVPLMITPGEYRRLRKIEALRLSSV